MTIQRAVEQQQEKRASTAAFLESVKPQLARALPRHLNADRLTRIALTEVRKTPALATCSQESFAGALLTSAQLGVEPGAGEAYLVPFKGEVTLIIGYQGYAKLFWQSPMAKHLDAQAVYENDHFEYEYGLTPRLVHRPATGERGKPVAFYAAATLTNGGSAFVVLTPDEVKKLRSGARASNIADPQMWMERKTALRQLFKLLPKSPELAAAMNADEQVHRAPTAPAEVAGGGAPELPAGVDAETGEVFDAEVLA